MLKTLKNILSAGAVMATVSLTAAAAQSDRGPGFDLDLAPGRTALLVADSQTGSLGPDSAAWGLVDQNFAPVGTDAHIDQLLVAATASGLPIFVSPRYFIAQRQDQDFGTTMQLLAPKISMQEQFGYGSAAHIDRTGPNWMAQIRKSVARTDGAPENAPNVRWPRASSLAQQLRDRGIEEVIIAGVLVSRSSVSEARELAAQGFKVLVVTDATADAKQPSFGVYWTVFGNVADTSTIVRTMQTAAGM